MHMCIHTYVCAYIYTETHIHTYTHIHMHIHRDIYVHMHIYTYIPPGEGKGYPLQYSGLENSMDCIVHGVAKSQR